MSLAFPEQSTLFRSRRMNASRVFSSISRSKPHTDSISKRRETTLPARYTKRSNRLYSVRVNEMLTAPRETSRLAGSRTRSPTRSLVSSVAKTRRFSVRRPGEKFVERVRFRHIVIRSQIKSEDDIRHGVLGRQHSALGFGFFPPADAWPVHTR